MTKQFSTPRTILFVLAISAMIASGCNRQKTNANIDDAEISRTAALADTTIVHAESVAEQTDSFEEQVVSVETDGETTRTQVDSDKDTPVDYYEDFVKLEINKEEGYEIRRVNELIFANSVAADTLLGALRKMSPIGKNENLTIYVKQRGIIRLEKTGIHGPRMVVEGEEKYQYHFGYIQIDTFFIDVTGSKDYYGEEVRENAERIFKKTGQTNDYKYKYYNPCPGGGKLYVFEITDSTVTTLYKGISE